MQGYTIKDVSKRMGIPTDTLRYYDKNGIISPQRKVNRYRCYSEHDILKLEYLTVMKYAHFSLEEIRDMLNMIDETPSQECKMRSLSLLINKRSELKDAIMNFTNIVALLDQTITVSEKIENYTEEHIAIDHIIHSIFKDIVGKDDSF